jgi:hypothetical protein
MFTRDGNHSALKALVGRSSPTALPSQKMGPVRWVHHFAAPIAETTWMMIFADVIGGLPT